MKIYTIFLLSLLLTQILSLDIFSCGEGLCSDDTCCACRQSPNQDTGNGFLEFSAICKLNGGGLHCVANSGCQLCHKPTFGFANIGDRPICARFAALNAKCQDENCCINQQNPNPTNGVGYLEFDADCKANGGGLHCVADSGCRLCFQPVLGGTNVGERPVCRRFSNMEPAPFTFPPKCIDQQCCLDSQKPNEDDGNGFLEFNAGCKLNGGGLHCLADSGCQLCYKPILGSVNVGDRPTCQRFLNLLPKCNNEQCCFDIQTPNENDGNGFLEFNAGCKLNVGGLHCLADSGCQLCYKPVLGGVNVGDRPTCARFSL